MTIVKVQVLQHGEGLPLPAYETSGSAGMDLRAAIGDDLSLAPLQRCLIPTGLKLALPTDFEAQIRPRSGLALKQGLTVLNAPGTIDSDYRGEVGVILVNISDEPAIIHRGDRIAQIVIAPVIQPSLDLVAELDTTKRGDNGFGSTGR